MMNEIVWSADPRPDLHVDSAMWATILTKAFAVDGHDPDGLFGALHGLRCLGAGLSESEEGWRIVPGEIGNEYRALCAQHLVRHAPLLRSLLAAVQQAVNTGAKRALPSGDAL